MDASQGPLAETARTRRLRPSVQPCRMHRLVHAPTHRRLDAVAQPCNGEMELRSAGRRLELIHAAPSEIGGPDGKMAGANYSIGWRAIEAFRQSGGRSWSKSGHSRGARRHRRLF